MQDEGDIITRFKQVYLEEFGDQISDTEALEKLTRLTNVLRVFLQSPPDSDHPDLRSPEDAV